VDWYPPPGESLLMRADAAFAAGLAPCVAGLRLPGRQPGTSEAAAHRHPRRRGNYLRPGPWLWRSRDPEPRQARGGARGPLRNAHCFVRSPIWWASTTRFRRN